MAKWYGTVGFVDTVETSPGVWTEDTIDRNYAGDILRNNLRWSANQDSTNDDLTINSQFSIVADPYAINNTHKMKYIEYMGVKWKITSVEPLRPRLILNVGGVYNVEQT